MSNIKDNKLYFELESTKKIYKFHIIIFFNNSDIEL